eukprot:3768738-Alexandrium_andersonii.AAC.1
MAQNTPLGSFGDRPGGERVGCAFRAPSVRGRSALSTCGQAGSRNPLDRFATQISQLRDPVAGGGSKAA